MKYVFRLIIILPFLIYYLFIIAPAITGKLNGTFQPHIIPNEYNTLQEYISTQKSYFRSLWIPTFSRYGYYSFNHPAISASSFYSVNNLSQILKKIKEPGAKRRFEEASIKYVIIPNDTESEIFISDRKYDEILHLTTIREISNLSWLKPVGDFQNTKVFEVSSYKDHFWSPQIKNINYITYNPTYYKVQISGAHIGDRLVFSDSYDKNWQILLGEQKIPSAIFHSYYNSFILPRGGNYEVSVLYSPQTWVNNGVVITICSLMLLLIFLSFNYLKAKK